MDETDATDCWELLGTDYQSLASCGSCPVFTSGMFLDLCLTPDAPDALAATGCSDPVADPWTIHCWTSTTPVTQALPPGTLPDGTSDGCSGQDFGWASYRTEWCPVSQQGSRIDVEVRPGAVTSEPVTYCTDSSPSFAYDCKSVGVGTDGVTVHSWSSEGWNGWMDCTTSVGPGGASSQCDPTWDNCLLNLGGCRVAYPEFGVPPPQLPHLGGGQ